MNCDDPFINGVIHLGDLHGLTIYIYLSRVVRLTLGGLRVTFDDLKLKPFVEVQIYYPTMDEPWSSQENPVMSSLVICAMENRDVSACFYDWQIMVNHQSKCM